MRSRSCVDFCLTQRGIFGAKWDSADQPLPKSRGWAQIRRASRSSSVNCPLDQNSMGHGDGSLPGNLHRGCLNPYRVHGHR